MKTLAIDRDLEYFLRVTEVEKIGNEKEYQKKLDEFADRYNLDAEDEFMTEILESILTAQKNATVLLNTE